MADPYSQIGPVLTELQHGGKAQPVGPAEGKFEGGIDDQAEGPVCMPVPGVIPGDQGIASLLPVSGFLDGAIAQPKAEIDPERAAAIQGNDPPHAQLQSPEAVPGVCQPESHGPDHSRGKVVGGGAGYPEIADIAEPVGGLLLPYVIHPKLPAYVVADVQVVGHVEEVAAGGLFLGGKGKTQKEEEEKAEFHGPGLEVPLTYKKY